MAKKSFLGNFLSSAAKAADKAIKEAAKERKRQEKENLKRLLLIERERVRQEKEIKKAKLNSLNTVCIDIETAKKYSSYSDSLKNAVTNSILKDSTSVEVKKSTLDRAITKYDKQKAKDEKLSKCAELNNLGKSYEESGNIEAAIQVYEENISLGYPATHSYQRLMTIYRKNKEFSEEIRVIKKAISVFTKENNRRAKKAIKANPELAYSIENALSNCEKVMGVDSRFYIFVPYDTNKYRERLEKAILLKQKNM